MYCHGWWQYEIHMFCNLTGEFELVMIRVNILYMYIGHVITGEWSNF